MKVRLIFVSIFSILFTNNFLYGQKLGTTTKPIFEEAASRGSVFFNYGTLNQFKSPSTRGTLGLFLMSNGNGTTTWSAVTGSGSDTNKVNTTGGDNMFGTYNLYGTFKATLSLRAKGNSTTLGLENTAGSATFLFSLPGSYSANTTYTVPSGYPSENDLALVSNTTGTMSWKKFYSSDSIPWIRNNGRSATFTRYADNVGIGTDNPSQKLHVDGSIKFTTNLFMETSTGAVGNIYKGGSLWMHNTEGGFYGGNYAGSTSITGTNNLCLSNYAGYSLTGGSENVLLGFNAGKNLTNGSMCVFVGPNAGYYETGDNIFILDNRIRSDENDTRYKSMMYGVFADNTADQILRVNGVFDWSVQPAVPKIFVQTDEPDIPNNTTAFWKDDAGYYWLILDVSGTQKKVRLQ
jgi:hypothetical protein